MTEANRHWTYEMEGLLVPEVFLEYLKRSSLGHFGKEIVGIFIGLPINDLDKAKIKKINKESEYKISLDSIGKLKKNRKYKDWAIVTRVSDLGKGDEIGVKSEIRIKGDEKGFRTGKHPSAQGRIEIVNKERFLQAFSSIERMLENKGLGERIIALYHTHPYDTSANLDKLGIKKIQKEITKLSDTDEEFFYTRNEIFSPSYGMGLFFGTFGYLYEGFFLDYELKKGKLGGKFSEYARIEKDRAKVFALRLFRMSLKRKTEEVQILLF